MKTLPPPPVLLDTAAPPADGRPPWLRSAATFAAGALLGSLAVGFQGSSPPATSAPPTTLADVAASTAASGSSSDATSGEAAATPLQELLEDPPFQPPTYNESGDRVLPLVFPDGSSLELVYGNSQPLHTRGALVTTSGTYAGGPARRIVLVPVRSDLIEWPWGAVVAFTHSGGDVLRVIDADRESAWLAFEFRQWTALVEEPPDASISNAELAGWAESFSAVRHPSGFIALRAAPPLSLAAAGEPDGPAVVLGGEAAEHATVRLAPCPEGDGATTVACFADLPVHVELSGRDEFVAEVVSAVRVRNYAPATPVTAATVTGPAAISDLSIADIIVTPSGALVGYGWSAAIDSHGAIFRSLDEGRTWHRGQVPGPRGVLRSMVLGADGRLLLGTVQWDGSAVTPTTSVWVSDDDAVSWSLVFAEQQTVVPGAGADIQVLAAPSGDVLLAGRGCITEGCLLSLRASVDGGESFAEERLFHPPDAAYTSLYATLFFQEARLVAQTQACRDVPADEGGYSCVSHILVSEDLGASWSEFSVPPEYQLASDVSNAVVSEGRVLAAALACGVDEACASILMRADAPGALAGVSEIPLPGVTHLRGTPAGALLAVGSGVVRSEDAGATWSAAQSPPVPGLGWFSSIAAAPDGVLYLGGWNDDAEALLWRSDDDGRTWIAVVGET